MPAIFLCRGKEDLLQPPPEASFFKIIFLMPVILKLFYAVPERLIHRSFTVTMKATENIVDYKVLYDELNIKHDDLEVRLADLTHQLAQLQKMIYGSRHERFVPTDDKNPSPQLSLQLDADTIATCKITDVKKTTVIRTKTSFALNKPTPHPGRMKLPESLRRETVILMPDCDVTGLKKIGEEITEILDFTPGEFYVKQYIRPKFIKPLSETNDTVITASLPGRMMEKCMAAEGLLAQILVDKYMDHMPLHRQLQRFARVGLLIAQSTINGWVKNALLLFVALYELHKQQLLNSGYLNVDETGIRVLDDDKKGKSHKGFYWVYHSLELKASLFDYQPGRGREGPNNILEKYQGFLQTDGYSTYEKIGAKQGVVHLGCMAHARRHFMEARQSDMPLADHALKMFQQLYAIEARIKDQALVGADKLRLRTDEAVPILKAMKKWLAEEYVKLRPTSPIAKAMAYSLPRMDMLTLYTTDARLNIDNNPVENAIRPVAIGRKNYLFAGSHEAAQRAAMMYSFFNTCRLHNINPYEWLKDVLEKMHLYTSSNLHELLPQNWAKIKKEEMG
jgi:transposase